jgi:hypothetical protein
MPAPCVTWFEFDLHHRVAPSHDRAIADDPLSNSEGVGVSLSPAECCLHGRQGMEHLWSRAVATGGNRWQMGCPENGSNKPKPLPWVATSCRAPKIVRRGRRFESVRGLRKAAANPRCLSRDRCHFGDCGSHRGRTPSTLRRDPLIGEAGIAVREIRAAESN